MARIEPFEKYHEEYDEWFVVNKDKYHLELEAVKHFIPLKGEGLEVGVGSGKFAAPCGIKTGVEPSEKMAEKARALGIDVLKGVAENLPVADRSFDFVLLVTTICFVDNIKKTFQEVNRILKDQGFIIVGFVDKESELGKKYIRIKDESKFYKAATFFSTQEVITYLTESGFHNFEIKQTIFPGNIKQTIEDGFGKGSFIVIKGSKINN